MAQYKQSKAAIRAQEQLKKLEQETQAKKRKIKKGIAITVAILIIITILIIILTSLNTGDYTQIYLGRIINSGGTDLTAEIKSLNGQKVVLRGYMAADSAYSGTMMYMVPTQGQSCPYCVGTFVDSVPILYKRGNSITFYNGLIEVYGTLEVSVKKDVDGYDTPLRIYIDKIKRL